MGIDASGDRYLEFVHFILVFPKNVQANLSPEQKTVVRKLVEKLKREG